MSSHQFQFLPTQVNEQELVVGTPVVTQVTSPSSHIHVESLVSNSSRTWTTSKQLRSNQQRDSRTCNNNYSIPKASLPFKVNVVVGAAPPVIAATQFAIVKYRYYAGTSAIVAGPAAAALKTKSAIAGLGTVVIATKSAGHTYSILI